MTAAFVLAVVAAACVQASVVLVGASWPRRSPAAAIVLWQAIGLSWGIAAVGTLIGVGAAGARPAVLTGAMDQVQRVAQSGLPLAGHVAEAIRLLCLSAGLVLLVLLCWIL